MSQRAAPFEVIATADPHVVARLPTDEASVFPWKVPAKKILVYIYQKPLRF